MTVLPTTVRFRTCSNAFLASSREYAEWTNGFNFPSSAHLSSALCASSARCGSRTNCAPDRTPTSENPLWKNQQQQRKYAKSAHFHQGKIRGQSRYTATGKANDEKASVRSHAAYALIEHIAANLENVSNNGFERANRCECERISLEFIKQTIQRRKRHRSVSRRSVRIESVSLTSSSVHCEGQYAEEGRETERERTFP